MCLRPPCLPDTGSPPHADTTPVGYTPDVAARPVGRSARHLPGPKNEAQYDAQLMQELSQKGDLRKHGGMTGATAELDPGIMNNRAHSSINVKGIHRSLIVGTD